MLSIIKACLPGLNGMEACDSFGFTAEIRSICLHQKKDLNLIQKVEHLEEDAAPLWRLEGSTKELYSKTDTNAVEIHE